MIVLECRDVMARFLKQKIRDQSKTFPGGLKGTITDTPENIFTQLALWAGFSASQIHVQSTGMTAITVSWDNETYESKIATLEDATRFLAWADVSGEVHFKEVSESTSAGLAMIYEEGGAPDRIGRLTELDYDIDWRDVHKHLIFVAKDFSDNTIQSIYTYPGESVVEMLDDDIFTYQIKGVAVTQARLDATAAEQGRRMAAGLRAVYFSGPAIPEHDIGDVIQVIESSTTISEYYRIDAISLSWAKGQTYMMTLECHHYGAAA
jgi:hypothetical protein